jgi:hypothetical protein
MANASRSLDDEITLGDLYIAIEALRKDLAELRGMPGELEKNSSQTSMISAFMRRHTEVVADAGTALLRIEAAAKRIEAAATRIEEHDTDFPPTQRNGDT